MLKASGSTALATHFEVRRRRTSPMAIGRKPPFFFLHGKREAPQRLGMTAEGAFPAHRRLTTLVRSCKALFARSGDGQKMASFR